MYVCLYAYMYVCMHVLYLIVMATRAGHSGVHEVADGADGVQPQLPGGSAHSLSL